MKPELTYLERLIMEKGRYSGRMEIIREAFVIYLKTLEPKEAWWKRWWKTFREWERVN